MPQLFNISLKVDPLVKKWLDKNFKSERGIYQFGNSCYYYAVSALLYQSHVKSVGYLPEKYNRFIAVKIAISEYDFYHYGWEVSELQELRFSRLLKKLILNECLTQVALLRANYNVSLTTALNTYIIQYNISEEDIKYETLRKIYNRKYRQKEAEYEKYNLNAISDFGTKDCTIKKKKLKSINNTK